MFDSGTEAIGVVIIDQHRMVAEGIARLLADEPDIEVLGLGTTSQGGIELVTSLRPSVVLVGYRLPDRSGISVVPELKRLAGDPMVVLVTDSPDDSVFLEAIEAGCSGFLTKDQAACEVSDAVRRAASGETIISPRDLARLLPQLARTAQQAGRELTQRESQILGMLARGAANSAIAAELQLSINTVRNYVQAILTKLGAHSKLEAVAVAVKEGLIDALGRTSR